MTFLRRLLGGGLVAGALALAVLAAPAPSLADGKAGVSEPKAGKAKVRKKPRQRAGSKKGARSGAKTSGSKKKVARAGSKVTAKSKRVPRGCKPQKARKQLVRGNFMKGGMLLPGPHQKAVRWRAEQYGYVSGLESYASESAISQAAATTFMGLPIRVHKKIVPKLRCVERRIRATCNGKGRRYVPRAIGGFREQNSYRQGEVSNHLFGIAIDIDPDRNPCCGCVEPWPSHPACKAAKKDPYEMSELPRCWVQAFERYGFYWLGRDQLHDTMHFEFLGDPDR